MPASEIAVGGDDPGKRWGSRPVTALLGSPGSYSRRVFAVIGQFVQAYLDPGTGEHAPAGHRGRGRSRGRRRTDLLAADSRAPAHPEEGRPAAVEPAFEPGSFRDPDSRVVVAGRDGSSEHSSSTGLEDWRALRRERPLRAGRRGRTPGSRTEEADGTAVPAQLPDGAAGILRHEAIPSALVSVPVALLDAEGCSAPPA